MSRSAGAARLEAPPAGGKALRPTAAQYIASDPCHSVWVSASAGTGKTRVLTERVLRLMLAGTPPSRILCLTFTNAAAAEMTARIHGELASWAVMDDDALARTLAALLDMMPESFLLARARRLFFDVADSPSDMKIQTIHGFCQALLRRFPLEAGVPPHFQVIDERTARELIQEAWSRILSGANGADSALSVAIGGIAAAAHDGAVSEIFQEIVGQRHAWQRFLSAEGGAGAALARVRSALGREVVQDGESLLRDACAEWSFDAGSLRRLAGILLESGGGDRARGEIMAAWLAADQEDRRKKFDDYANVFLRKEDDGPKAVSFVMTKKPREAHPDMLESAMKEQARLYAVKEALKSCRTARLTEHLLSAAEALLALYSHLKNTRARLDYDDLIMHAGALLSERDAAPWVMFKLDGGIDHILVDEAQDVSPDQWAIIQALCEEFFSGAGRREETRTVFIVGDEKQSIFSFQGADPAAFGRMKSWFAERVAGAGMQWREVALERSFRSTEPVLRLVDAIFADDALRRSVTWETRKVMHSTQRSGEAGRVELWPLVYAKSDSGGESWPLPAAYRQKAAPKRMLAEKIAETIRTWLDTGRILPALGRKVAPGDIMILLRRRRGGMDTVIRALERRGIPASGADRLELKEHIAVMDLLALGQWALLPEDDLTLAALLRSPLLVSRPRNSLHESRGRKDTSLMNECHVYPGNDESHFRDMTLGVTEEELFGLAHDRGSLSIWRRLQETNDPALDGARRYLAALLAKADFLPPLEFYLHVLEAAGGRKSFAARLGHEVNDVLDEFLNLAELYGRTHAPSMQGFLHWMRQSGSQVKRDLEQGGGAVRVMTVHGAKGLQAPVVFLFDTADKPGADADHVLWTEEGVPLWPGNSGNRSAVSRRVIANDSRLKHDEYIRLFYVAMTRAADELYICGWRNGEAAQEGSWYAIARRAMEGLVVENGEGVLVLEQAGGAEIFAQAAMAEKEIPALPEFARTQAKAEPPPAARVSPSLPEDDGAALPISGGGRRRGTLMHALLQYLPQCVPEKRREKAMLWLARQAPELSGAMREEMTASILGVINFADDKDTSHMNLCHVYPGNNDDYFRDMTLARAEAPVAGILPDGRVISGRIDRLIVTEREALIVDYKTHADPPMNAEAVPGAHLAQMAAYRDLLRRIYPDKTVRCALLWTAVPVLMELPDTLLDRYGETKV